MPAYRLTGLLVLTLVGLAPCRAETEMRLVAGDYPPLVSAELPQQGAMSAEVLRLFRAIGFAPRLLPLVPWPRALAMVKSGQADATFGWGYAEQRRADFLSTRPFFRSPRKFFARIGHKPHIGLEELPGHSLCLPQSHTVPAEIAAVLQNQPVRLERPTDAAACLRMVAAGRVDYFLQAEAVGQYLVEQAGLGAQLRAAENIVGHAEFHILLPRHARNSAAIVQRLNSAIARGAVRPLSR